MNGDILVVGDGFSQGSGWLRDEGLTVALTGDGEEALALGLQADLVIVQAELPPRGGMAFFQTLRDRRFQGPVLFVSARPEMAQVREALRLGAVDYLILPVARESLLAVVERALSGWRQSLDHERRARNLVFAFRHVPEGMVVVDGELAIRSINQEAGRLCPRLAPLLPGEPFPQDPPCKNFCRPALQQVLQGELPSPPQGFTPCPARGQTARVRVCTLPAPVGKGRMALLMIESLKLGPSLEEAAWTEEGVLIGDSRAMRQVRALVAELAPMDTTVLLTGESGTGKERVALALHRAGPRAGHPLVRVFCGGQSDLHLAGELFGQVPGAYPGALEECRGAFSRAHGGTLFLCEIGELSLGLQGRIARVVEEKRLARLGEDEPFHVDARIIAATRWNLRERLEQGLLRPELYYRLKGVEIDLPPLRKRKEDLPDLARHFLVRVNLGFGKQVAGFGRGVMETLLRYDWPGNLRELEHALAQAVLTCRGEEIQVADLPWEVRAESGAGDESERLRQVLGRTGGVKTQAARELGISRSTLYRRMRRMGAATA